MSSTGCHLPLAWAPVRDLSVILQYAFLYIDNKRSKKAQVAAASFLKAWPQKSLDVICQKSQKASTIQGVGKCTPQLHGRIS